MQMMIQSAGSRDLQKEPTGGLSDDLVRVHQAKPEFKQEYLTEMVASTIRAGGDTLTATLAAVVSQANLHPQVKARVTKEVEGVGSIASFHDGTKLPFTAATIKEAMRHWPVVGLAMYREVPKNGLTLNGYYIPPGTTVGCSPLALQCNEAIFGEDANKFRPDKWLDEKDRVPLERYSLGFGSQNRSCPGRNISEQCIYKAFPTLMKHFDIEVEMPSEMLTYGTSIMTGVKARFKVRRLAG
jgi:cytochrome P450